jgi:hypothetical protein
MEEAMNQYLTLLMFAAFGAAFYVAGLIYKEIRDHKIRKRQPELPFEKDASVEQNHPFASAGHHS